MAKKKELTLTVNLELPLAFECMIEGNGIEAERYTFRVIASLYWPSRLLEVDDTVPPQEEIKRTLALLGVSEQRQSRRYFDYLTRLLSLKRTQTALPMSGIRVHPSPNELDSPIELRPTSDPQMIERIVKPDFQPIYQAMYELNLPDRDVLTINQFWFPNLLEPGNETYIPDIDNPILPEQIDARQGIRYMGDLLAGALEEVDYIITLFESEYYFNASTATRYFTPLFGYGLQKTIEPEETGGGYTEKITYLTYEKAQSKSQVQLELLDTIPEEKYKTIHKMFQRGLTPYGLKCLYLILEECDRNQRRPWFTLDTNRCLDLLGYNRDRRGIHTSRNKIRFREILSRLTKMQFNVLAKAQIPGKETKEKIFKFQGNLISTIETGEVEKGQPWETAKMDDGIIISINQAVYGFMDEGWYKPMPHAFLAIDAQRKGRAINLYSYISDQWRVGLKQYKGIIKQPLKQILDGAGLLESYPKRRNQQRDFTKKILSDLEWLREQKDLWIDSVKVKTIDRPELDPMIVITMSDNHPLRGSMTKLIEAGKDTEKT